MLNDMEKLQHNENRIYQLNEQVLAVENKAARGAKQLIQFEYDAKGLDEKVSGKIESAELRLRQFELKLKDVEQALQSKVAMAEFDDIRRKLAGHQSFTQEFSTFRGKTEMTLYQVKDQFAKLQQALT